MKGGDGNCRGGGSVATTGGGCVCVVAGGAEEREREFVRLNAFYPHTYS